MNEKRTLRAELVAARAALSPAERAECSARIAQRVAALPAFRSARTIAAFAPLGAEVDGLACAARARALGIPVVFPRVRADGRLLEFAACAPEALERGPLGAAQPPPGEAPVALGEVDLVLVPGVAFSADGHRLGRGGGYYDTTLAAMPRALRVGVAFELQVLPALPCEPHDARLDALVTESRTLGFSRDSR